MAKKQISYDELLDQWKATQQGFLNFMVSQRQMNISTQTQFENIWRSVRMIHADTKLLNLCIKKINALHSKVDTIILYAPKRKRVVKKSKIAAKKK